jgi:decaprenyl-diphosphate synthase subunit 1
VLKHLRTDNFEQQQWLIEIGKTQIVFFSSEQLGKPAAADLELGLATAPVLFACAQFPELEDMIARRFSKPGDVQAAFEAVLSSDGLERTRSLARNHCEKALESIGPIADSKFKSALATMTDTVLTRMK